MVSEFHSHPLDTANFEFIDTRGDGKAIRIIKSHVAYDYRWPWWRKWWANMRGRP